MRIAVSLKVAAVGLLTVGAATIWADEAAAPAKDAVPAKTSSACCAMSDAACPTNALKPQTLCPVDGGKISTNLFVETGKCRIYLCSQACADKAKTDPKTYCKKVIAAGEHPACVKAVGGHACPPGADAAKCGMMKSPMCPFTLGAGTNAAAGDTNAPVCPMK